MTPTGFDMLPLDGPGRGHYPKPADTGWQEAEILITVKATPQPSQKYGDTVCVAGIRMTDQGPEWIRLYPVPFRSMNDLEKFRKYEILRIKVKPAKSDYRAESFNLDRSSLQRLEFLEPWKQRHRWVSPMVGEWSMCRILSTQRAHGHKSHPSLAAVKPAEIYDLAIEEHEGWTPSQKASLLKDLQQGSLFGEEENRLPLEAPRFRAKYHYRCEDSACPGHKQTIIDWELTALMRKHKGDSDTATRAGIRDRFLEQMADPVRGPVLFVGNLMATPRAFNVLGVYRTISAK